MKQISTFEQYKAAYQSSIENPEKFWGEVALDFTWRKTWDKVLQWNFTEPTIEWFAGGECNLTENCIDRHLHLKPRQPALIWEPNNPIEDSRTITYAQLHSMVCSFANALVNLGVKPGHRVCIYMPMIPETAIAMLACARI